MILLADGPPGDLATAGGWPKPRPARRGGGPVQAGPRVRPPEGADSESELLANAMLELEEAAAGSSAVRSAKGGATGSKRSAVDFEGPGAHGSRRRRRDRTADAIVTLTVKACLAWRRAYDRRTNTHARSDRDAALQCGQ